MEQQNMPQPTVKFRIHRSDGSTPESLKNAFVMKYNLKSAELAEKKIKLADGTVWHLVLDERDKVDIEYSIYQHSHLECIFSFQAHTFGNFAVARTIKEKPAKKKDNV